MVRLLGTACFAGLLLVLTCVAPALAQSDVVLAPSARAPGCIFAAGAKGLAPLPPGCAAGSVSGDPVFAPDGKMLYVGDRVLARDPSTGALTSLSCDAPSGFRRCPSYYRRLMVAPDGRFLYSLTPTTLDVIDRDADGDLPGLVQCLSPVTGGPDEPDCDHVLPEDVKATGGIAMSADGSVFYVAGQETGQWGRLLEFTRDASTGRLNLADCVSEVDRDGCTTDPYLHFPSIVAAVGQDVYVDTETGIIGFRPRAPTGRLLENRCRGWQTTSGPCPTHTDSPEGGPIVPSADGRWLYGTNGGSIAAWPRDPATGLLGAATCAGPWCHAPGESASLALSPDGRTLVTTAQHTGLYGNHDQGGRNVPGDGRDSAVFTFRADDAGRVRFVGCVGNVAGCAMPFGDAVAAIYPSSGPGPYLVGERNDQRRHGIQLLAEAPTVSFAAITFKEANPASVACPAGRTQACRGTVELSRLVYTHCCEGGAGNPTVRRLRRIHYDASPGSSTSISLRIPARARAGFHRIVRLDRPGVNHTVGMLVKVTDAAGLTLPTGTTVCLEKAPKGLRCEYSD